MSDSTASRWQSLVMCFLTAQYEKTFEIKAGSRFVLAKNFFSHSYFIRSKMLHPDQHHNAAILLQDHSTKNALASFLHQISVWESCVGTDEATVPSSNDKQLSFISKIQTWNL